MSQEGGRKHACKNPEGVLEFPNRPNDRPKLAAANNAPYN